MSPDELLMMLRHQRARGPLPGSAESLSGWLAVALQQLPTVRLEVPRVAVSPLRAIGIIVEDEGGAPAAHVPADGDGLDRMLALLGLPALERGGAGALIEALERGEERDSKPPPLSLRLRVQPAKASSLGWSSELFFLTVLVSNVRLRDEDGAVLSRGEGPIVAVCAEYDRPLTSLDPPGIAGYAFERARALGVPMLRLREGFLRTPLRLEATGRNARAPAGRPEALARAGRFLDDLGEAWKRRLGPMLEVAWPVYRPHGSGPLLDAVCGAPLPEMQIR